MANGTRARVVQGWKGDALRPHLDGFLPDRDKHHLGLTSRAAHDYASDVANRRAYVHALNSCYSLVLCLEGYLPPISGRDPRYGPWPNARAWPCLRTRIPDAGEPLVVEEAPQPPQPRKKCESVSVRDFSRAARRLVTQMMRAALGLAERTPLDPEVAVGWMCGNPQDPDAWYVLWGREQNPGARDMPVFERAMKVSTKGERERGGPYHFQAMPPALAARGYNFLHFLFRTAGNKKRTETITIGFSKDGRPRASEYIYTYDGGWGHGTRRYNKLMLSDPWDHEDDPGGREFKEHLRKIISLSPDEGIVGSALTIHDDEDDEDRHWDIRAELRARLAVSG